ncbi:hypothetical protein MF271_15740 [Deinococcus sp. KNUC1210]|uniref:hypothetical protein n=1 Tax=Deinococcus sp. KNUC1210 TaxID=2917691 RepID=UPI001EF1160A|nr:hypothetical protein [Deinococcus sp. KNUC1210]ULH15364.1 hypothetical protein MF271_15740 [Deinococcus sp. KNUC1210]
MDGQESFREQVERLVAEGKLTQDEAAELLKTSEQPTSPEGNTPAADAGDEDAHGPLVSLDKSSWAAVQVPSSQALGDIPPDLRLKVDGYGLQVVLDASQSQPTLRASQDGELSLRAGPDGWTVERTEGLRGRKRSWGLKAVLSVPFMPRDVQAEVNGGNLTLADVSGNVRLNVNGGNTRMGSAAGLEAEVSGGNLGARQILGAARISVSGGNARLDSAGGVRATINGGNLNWSGRLEQGEHRIEVNAGNATLHLLEGSSVEIQADVTLGGMMASFPLIKTGGMMQAHYSGTLGGGEAHLGCTVNAGQIKVVTA